MRAFIVRIAINAAALLVAAWAVQWAQEHGFIGGGIRLQGAEAVLLTALIFGLVNAFIRPLVLLFTCLLNLLTLGLFTLVVNAVMLLLTSWMVEQINRSYGATIDFHVDGFIPAFVGALIISIVSFVLTKLLR